MQASWVPFPIRETRERETTLHPRFFHSEDPPRPAPSVISIGLIDPGFEHQNLRFSLSFRCGPLDPLQFRSSRSLVVTLCAAIHPVFLNALNSAVLYRCAMRCGWRDQLYTEKWAEERESRYIIPSLASFRSHLSILCCQSDHLDLSSDQISRFL